MIVQHFIIALVGFAVGIVATREYYKSRVKKLVNTHIKDRNNIAKLEYRQGWEAGVRHRAAYPKRSHPLYSQGPMI